MSDPERPAESPSGELTGDGSPGEAAPGAAPGPDGAPQDAPATGPEQAPDADAIAWWRREPGPSRPPSEGTPPGGTLPETAPPGATPPFGTPPFGTGPVQGPVPPWGGAPPWAGGAPPWASGAPPWASGPPWAGGPPPGTPPWTSGPPWYGWGYGWSGAPTQVGVASGVPGTRRRPLPWAVIAAVLAAIVLVALGLGVGYSVWGGTTSAPARSNTAGPPARISPLPGRGGFLGVEVSASGLGAGATSSSPASTPGAYVDLVLPGSPAARAGIVKGDTITEFGTRPVRSPVTLRVDVLSRTPGSRVKLGWVTAAGKHRSATVTLARRPATKSVG